MLRKLYYLCSECDAWPATAVTSVITFLHAGDKMANDLLKQAFQKVHLKFVNSINPDPVMDVLFSKNIISSDQFGKLRHVSFLPDRCRDLLTLLHNSSHPQTFVHLRLALLHEQSWIVDEIDKLLTSPTSQLQQLRLDHTTDGIN